MISKIEIATGAFGDPFDLFAPFKWIGTGIKNVFTGVTNMFGAGGVGEVAEATKEVTKSAFNWGNLFGDLLKTGITSFAQFKLMEWQWDMQKEAKEGQVAQQTAQQQAYYSMLAQQQEAAKQAGQASAVAGIDTKTLLLIGGAVVGTVLLTTVLTGKKK